MTETHVISALIKRRSDLSGEVQHAQQHVRKLIADLDNLDATILQFDSDYQVNSIKPKGFRPPSDWASRGEMSRSILCILRQATAPLTTQEVAIALMKSRELDTDDVKMVRKMTKRTSVALRAQRENGLLKSTQGTGLFMMWEINS